MTATIPAMVQITPEAGEQLRGLMQNDSSSESGLRVWVQSSCGCSGGVSYGMGIDDQTADDTTFSSEGIKLIIDPGSASLLSGAIIDFVDYGAQGRGFLIHTDDQMQGGSCGSGCGCGAH